MEENISKAETIAKSVEKISDSKGLAAIGEGLGSGLVAIAVCMTFLLLAFALKWDGNLHEQKQCYELKEVKGSMYTLNTCTGELIKVEEKALEN